MNGSLTENLVIKASAGTGKTFSIATRYLRLLILGGATPEQILALTFSRAAAQEIYEKILDRLWKAAGADVGDWDEKLGRQKTFAEVEAERLAAATEERKNLVDRWHMSLSSDGDVTEVDRKELAAQMDAERQALSSWTHVKFAALLRRILDAQHHDTIATLDSFIMRIVRSFPLEMGFQRAVSVLDNFGEEQAVKAAVTDVFSAADGTAGAEDVADAFEITQNGSAVRNVLGKVMAGIKAWRKFIHEHPEAMSWTMESMCAALGIEVDEKLECQKVDLSTISVSDKEQSLLLKFIGYVDDFDGTKNIFPDTESGRMSRFFMDNPEAESYEYESRKKPHVFDCGRSGAESIRAAVRHMASVALKQRLARISANLRLASAVDAAYGKVARDKGLLTFSDFTECQAACEGSEKGLALENLQFRLDSRFDHWALDEFQDTSMPQWECLKRLVSEAACGEQRSAMAVGDLKQSIYAWRGGDDRPFGELIDNLGRRCVKKLDISHRYQLNTAIFINAVFGPENIKASAGDSCAKGVQIWEKDCWPREGHKPEKNTDGTEKCGDYVEIVGVDPDAAKDTGEDDDCYDDMGEDRKPSKAILILAPNIRKCVRSMWHDHEDAKSTETIGILVRKNADGLYLAEQLRKENGPDGKPLPVVWEGTGGVLDDPVARAVLELLSLSEHPEDRFSWAVINTIFPIRERVFPKLENAALVSAEVARRLSRHGLARAIREIVSSLGEMTAGTGRRARTAERLEGLVREAVKFEGRPDAAGGIGAFRRYLGSATDRDTASSSSVIRILTIHRSKGLGIDHVIVPIHEVASSKDRLVEPSSKSLLLGDGWVFSSLPRDLARIFPATREALEAAANGHFLETLRTNYVALTRAKKTTRVFVVEDDGIGGQFRGLLLRPFRDSEKRKCNYGENAKILHSIGTPTQFGRKDEVAAAKPDEWVHAKGREIIRHETPSAGMPLVPHGDGLRRAADPFVERHGSAVRRGTEAHADFAKIEWIDMANPKDSHEREILARDKVWREAFAQTPGATVWREQSYEIFDRTKSEWETGQFDRVVFRVTNGIRSAEIYDFKTNAKTEKSTVEFELRMRETYKGQMNTYRRALSRLCGINEAKISSTLLFTATGTGLKI